MSKVVLITGCSTGIGRDLPPAESSGNAVVATARNAATLEDVPAALKLSLDVTQPDSVNDAVARTLQQFGRIDVLVDECRVCPAWSAGRSPRRAGPTDVRCQCLRRPANDPCGGSAHAQTGKWAHHQYSLIAGEVPTPANGILFCEQVRSRSPERFLRLRINSVWNSSDSDNETGAIKTNFDETAQSHAQGISGIQTHLSPVLPEERRVCRLHARAGAGGGSRLASGPAGD